MSEDIDSCFSQVAVTLLLSLPAAPVWSNNTHYIDSSVLLLYSKMLHFDLFLLKSQHKCRGLLKLETVLVAGCGGVLL